jgi:ATP/maltotriose-dependent transcriptional regulator MalT
MIYACERVRDFDRAGQWCVQMKAFCERAGLATLTAVCRTHYASVLTERGDWREAEAELMTAGKRLAARPTQAAEAVARLGELRRMQGRLDEAADLLHRVGFHPRAQLAQAALSLARGEPEEAIGWVQRFLRQVPASDRTQRAVALELLARARSATGDVDGARSALGELEAVARMVDSDLLWAAVAFATGVVESKTGNLDGASGLLEDAVDRYERCGLPFEAAECRMALADVLRKLGRSTVADREQHQARQTLERLGAALSSERNDPPPSTILTARELEILRLVADGLSDHGIAERLVLSPHTVHRHVSNILSKLAESSRSAAVARAARAGLL